MTRALRRTLLTAFALGLLAVGCDTPATAPLLAPDTPVRAATSAVPAQGTAATLDFGTWNLEWFGDTGNGPSNEALQLENVRDIIAGLDMDLWSVQEVTGHAHFADLVSQLSGYDGFLADDPIVTDGDAYYSDFDDNEHKVGLIYKPSMVTINGAKVILKEYDYQFAGRPPVEVSLSATVDGATLDLVVVLLHAKAGASSGDWQRRYDGSVALKSYLDATHPTARVMVIGDFNDDVDTSITNRPTESPYRNFVDDAAYVFPTKAMSDAGISSMVYYDDIVDHHLATDELVATYVAGSVQVFPADQYLADYPQTTSDHYPVLSSYTAGSGSDGGTTNSPPTAIFTWSCTDLTCDFDGSGSSDTDGSITSYAWDFGDGATATGVTASHSYAAGGTYTVALTVTDDAGATGSDAQNVSVAEPTTGGISLSATGYKRQGTQHVDLAWSGAASTNVDVYRDGAVIATIANDGAFTDSIGARGGGSYAYKVCEAGTATCSNEATVTF